ncbi:MAG TPA: DinB family protein [Thermoanaerobaculia bacterium]|nr:DinB family protein [Thermoanaerobaculia bacterium]
MPPRTTLIEEALEAWEFARDGVIAELRNLPESGFSLRPAPEARSVLELAQHILESGNMMAGELSRRDGDFRRMSYEGFLKEYGRGISSQGSKRRLLAALRKAHADGARKIRAAGELHMLQNIRRFDGQMGTRLAWMHHGISHEEYHRGQLALCARLLGRVPALTKRIMGG